jgi:PPOX class probable F420-dependent enzyme
VSAPSTDDPHAAGRATARHRLATARVGRLATLGADAQPHLVPCCFVLVGETLFSAVDAKPKSTLALRRLANIAAHPAVAFLVDHYDEDWSALWWVRVDGRARVLDADSELEAPLGALRDKYPQYHQVPVPGPMIAIDVQTWRWWP